MISKKQATLSQRFQAQDYIVTPTVLVVRRAFFVAGNQLQRRATKSDSSSRTGSYRRNSRSS